MGVAESERMGSRGTLGAEFRLIFILFLSCPKWVGIPLLAQKRARGLRAVSLGRSILECHLSAVVVVVLTTFRESM